MPVNTIASWEARQRAKVIPDWDDFDSEVDEADFEAMLEESDEEVEELSTLHNDPSMEPKQVVETPKTSSSVKGASESSFMPYTHPAGRVSVIFELVERILLKIPAYEVFHSCQCVQRFWRDVIRGSSALGEHMGDLLVATLVWPPKPIPEHPRQLVPFRAVRQKFFEPSRLTRDALEDYREASVRGCMYMNAAYHAANQAKPLPRTLEADLRGKYVVCRVCKHLHERFRFEALHLAISSLCFVENSDCCFTGYGTHVVLQVQVKSMEWVDKLAVYVRKLLDTREDFDKLPLAKCMITRLTLSLEGDMSALTSIKAQTPQDHVRVGQVLKLITALTATLAGERVEEHMTRLDKLYEDLHDLHGQIDVYMGFQSEILPLDVQRLNSIRGSAQKETADLKTWLPRDEAWQDLAEKQGIRQKKKRNIDWRKVGEVMEAGLARVRLHMGTTMNLGPPSMS